MKSIFVDFTKYKPNGYQVWANQKAISLLKDNITLLNSLTQNGFPTLANTIQHIWYAEEIWLARWWCIKNVD